MTNGAWPDDAKQSPTGGLTFPIKLRCASPADLLSVPGLEAALSRALGRAFARARVALPVHVAPGSCVMLQPPELVNTSVSVTNASTVLARVRRAIEAAAGEAGLAVSRSGAHARRRPLPSNPSEKFDRTRYDWRTGLYEVPSYDPVPQGKKAQIPLAKDPAAALDWTSVLDGLIDPDDYKASRAFYAIYDLILAWDEYAIPVVMSGVHADGSPR
jgi:hypothetical protein